MNLTLPIPDDDHPSRAVVHAGPLLLERREGPHALSRYLERDDRRDLYLVHRGQPFLRTLAREAGVPDLRVVPDEAHDEAERTAELALELGAETLEFTIDRPALTTDSGRAIGEMTLREAERYAGRDGLRPRIRAKLLAACDALRRGVQRVRIGDPTALLRGRATLILPDSPFTLGMALPLSEGGNAADAVPAASPREMPTPIAADAATRQTRGARERRRPWAPPSRCRIGRRTTHPFPDLLYDPRNDDRRGRRSRSRRPALRAA